MQGNRLVIALVLTQLSMNIYATEIDSFTLRDPELIDASQEVNHLMNGYLAAAAKEANRKGSCNQVVLSNALLDQFGEDPWPHLETDIDANPNIDKRHNKLSESIYRDFTPVDGFALYLAKLGTVIRIGDFYIGADKLGHFGMEGYTFYEKLYVKGHRFENALDWSEFSEHTYYGTLTTGVYSYGDLAANYDGLYFWERVTNTGLPSSVQPYFVCVDDQWQQTESFEIADYANAAWDEGINCSVYKTTEMEKQVEARIAELEAATGRSLQCPIAPEQCSQMIERYGNMARHLVTPKCF